jgi:hypothetical protein
MNSSLCWGTPTKLVSAAGLVFLVTGSTIASGQTAASSVTTVGCVNRAVHNGSLAGGPGIPPTTPNSAAVLANSNEPTDVFLLNGAGAPRPTGEPAAKGTSGAPPVSYVLDGSLTEFEKHLGQQVEVTGTVQTVNEGAKEAKTPVRHLKVRSIKMLAAECSKPADRPRK